MPRLYIPGSKATGEVLGSVAFEYPAFNLISFDAFEQCFEVAFAEPVVAFALDELEEDWPDHRLAENL
jgi:hypothetical protein